MDAPKCRACGKRHWGSCVEAMGLKPAESEETPPEAAPAQGKKARQARYRERNREHYNARQRELMRNRRKRQGDG